MVIVATLALVGVTIAVFIRFDAVSHSNSDTLRPFVLTVVPMWVAFGLIVRSTGRRRRDP